MNLKLLLKRLYFIFCILLSLILVANLLPQTILAENTTPLNAYFSSEPQAPYYWPEHSNGAKVEITVVSTGNSQYNSLGWYDISSPTDLHTIVTGGTIGMTIEFTPSAEFGLYLIGVGGTKFFSQTQYSDTDQSIQHFKINNASENTYSIGIEDWAGGDFDYNDLVITMTPLTQQVILLVHGWQGGAWYEFNSKWQKMIEKICSMDEDGKEFSRQTEALFHQEGIVNGVTTWVIPSNLEGPLGPYFSRDGSKIVYISNYSINENTNGYPCILTAPVQTYAKQLAKEISVIRQNTGVDEIDIVAHSMGGLVSRTYSECGDFGLDIYGEDTNNLIMLGTPNRGVPADLAALLIAPFWEVNPNYGCMVQMCARSAFLRLLNYGTIWVDPEYSDPVILNEDINYYTVAGNPGNFITEPWDSVIEVRSVRLNPDIPFYIYPGIYHTDLISNSEITTLVKSILDGSAINPWSEELSTLQITSTMLDNLSSWESKSTDVSVTSTSQVIFTLYCPNSSLEFTLTSPDNTEITPLTPEIDSNISYIEYNSNDNFIAPGYIAQYIINDPEPGSWEVNTSASAVPEEGANYSIVTSIDSSISLSTSLSQDSYQPNSPVIVSGNFVQGTQGISGASVIAIINRPNGQSNNLALYDDGQHNDNQANDGIYANTYSDTSDTGIYNIRLTGEAVIDNEDITRLNGTLFWVEQFADVNLSSNDISFSNNNPVENESVTVTATIHNAGDIDATDVNIMFFNGEPKYGNIIGETTVTVPAGSSINANVNWTATSGSHDIYVGTDPFTSTFNEDDYSNNVANKTINVSGIHVFINIVSGGDTIVPSSFTIPATDITTTGAVLNGILTDLGTATTVDVYFEWGTTNNYGNTTTSQPLTTSSSFYDTLTQLAPDTKYYYRAVVVGDGTSYGDEQFFITSTHPPVVNTNQITNKTATGATLNGYLTDLGTATTVDLYFEWGTDPNNLNNSTTPQTVNSTGTFSAVISGLSPGLYYFRTVAVGDETARGGILLLTIGTYVTVYINTE